MEEDLFETDLKQVLQEIPKEEIKKKRVKKPYLRRTNRPLSEGEYSLLKSLTNTNNYLQLIQEGRQIQYSETGPKVGPGYYSTNRSSLSGPSFWFPTQRRFDQTTPIRPYRLSYSKNRGLSRFRLNRDMKKYSPQFRAFMQDQKIKQILERRKKVKEKKQKEQEIKKNRLIERAENKQRRFFFNQNRQEIYRISNSWAVLFLILGSGSHTRILLKNKKLLRARIKKFKTKVTIFCTMIGKFKRRAKRAREIIAQKKIALFQRHVKTLIARKRVYHRQILSELSQEYYNMSMWTRFMYHWFKNMIYIQRALKRLMYGKKWNLANRRKAWNQTEVKMFKKGGKKKITDSKRSGLKGSTTIPDQIKDKYIQQLLRRRAKDYHTKVVEYNQQYKALKDEWYRDDQIELVRPTEDYLITPAYYKRMIKKALKNRVKWSKTINQQT